MAYYRVIRERNSIEIYFDSMPSDEIKKLLKSGAWRWHKVKRCWYNQNSFESRLIAHKICNSMVDSETEDKNTKVKTLDEIDDNTEDLVILGEGEIILTKEQQACVDYVGSKNKNLAIRSCPGGGKTIVLVKRAIEYLKVARINNKKRYIAVFTHNRVLANYLKELIGITESDKDYIRIGTLQEYVKDVYDDIPGFKLGNKAYTKVIERAMDDTLEGYKKKYKNDKYIKWGRAFWFDEFAWMRNMNIFDVNDRKLYMDLVREGRGHTHPMTKLDREAAFEMFISYQGILRSKKVYDPNPAGNERALYLTHNSGKISQRWIYDHVLIDEAQDQTLTNMIALERFAKSDLTICLDVNQRIYENRWRLSQAVTNVTSKILPDPFRCTRQIDELAESLRIHNEQQLDEEEKTEHRKPIAPGEKPEVIHCMTEDEEILYTINTVKRWLAGDPNHTIGIMCYTNEAVKKVAGWLSKDHISFQHISSDKEAEYSILQPGVKLCTMHTSKGLEFMRVILPQFYEGMIPKKWAYEDEEKLIKQRNTAYVAMTRAQHQLVIVYSGPKSQFVKELDPKLYTAIEYEDAVKRDKKSTVSQPEPRRIPRSILPGEEKKNTGSDNQEKQSRRSKYSLLDDTE